MFLAGFPVQHAVPGFFAPAVLLSAALLVLAAHECGHLAAGLWQGMNCHLFVVGPLLLRRERGHLRLGWNRSFALAGGAVMMLPADDRNLIRRVGWMVAGGPLASLMLAVAACGVHEMTGSGPISRLFWFLGVCSACIFVITAFPMRLGQDTDGARVLMLWRGGPKAERWCAQLALFGVSAEAVRPGAWSPGIVSRAIEDETVVKNTGLALLAYQWFLDRGEIEEARTWMNTATGIIGQLPRPLRSAVAAEAAYFHGLYGGRQEELQGWLARAREAGTALPDYTRWRAIAAVAQAESNVDDAIRAISEARRALEKTRRNGMTSAESDWLERIAEAMSGCETGRP